MTKKRALNPTHVKKSIVEIKKMRPAYASLLDFYEKIFLAQEDSKSRVKIDSIQIPNDMLAVKTREKFPLINISDFVVDTNASEILLKKICDIAAVTKGYMAANARVIRDAIDTEKLDSALLFSSLLEEDDIFFEAVADELEIEKKMLAFVTYSSIIPSISLCVQDLTSYLDQEHPWERGYCPICGSPPVLSMLADEGQRFLFCSFCWHKWPVSRGYCPFCESRDGKTLHYFFSEEEKDYRVDLCDRCHKYIKTVDTRETKRYFYPPLEQVATLHLDIKARDMGYESGVQLVLET